MKELSIEEKAQAYDKAIEKLRDFYRDYNTISGLIDVKEELSSIFPELKESEDERIRKGIIRNLEYLMDSAEGFVKDELKERIAWLEKQAGQNHTDEVKPKFKVGDWVVNNDDDSVGQITKIIEGEDGFAYEHTNGYFHGIFEKDFHLWTIQDAKDGDFLACPLPKGGGEQVFIFKEIGKREYIDDCIEYYCRVCQGVFYESNMGFMGTASDEFKPATQEQRTLLIQKMHETGYEWNPDKKKLEKKPKRMVSAEAKEGVLNEKQEEQVSEEFINALGTMLND